MAEGVVLLHGIARRTSSMGKLDRSLGAAGFLTLNLGYRSRRKPIQGLVEDIHGAVATFAERLEGPIHFVTHSMGGLVARAYLTSYRPAELGRVVMLGPPNGGSEVADLLQRRTTFQLFFGPAGRQLVTRQDKHLRDILGTVDYPLGIIAGAHPWFPAASAVILPGPNDGKVTVRSTKVDGMADHIEVATSHTTLVRHPLAIRQTIEFLRRGQFTQDRV